jgi:hypothetical protein
MAGRPEGDGVIYMECRLCLDESKGEKHTALQWIGPGEDIHICPVCDLLTGRSV